MPILKSSVLHYLFHDFPELSMKTKEKDHNSNYPKKYVMSKLIFVVDVKIFFLVFNLQD